MTTNRKVFAAIALLAVAIAAGGVYLWTKAPGLMAAIPDPATATSADLDAGGDVKGTYIMARMVMIYESKGGDLSTDAKIDAFGQAIGAACTDNPAARLQDVVDGLAKDGVQ
jgi:hypothetical protein